MKENHGKDGHILMFAGKNKHDAVTHTHTHTHTQGKINMMHMRHGSIKQATLNPKTALLKFM